MAGIALDGVLCVDKPSGPTSHDIVAGARHLYGTRTVGHAGTLDPLASGVMLLLLGQATKLSNYLLSQDKCYVATVTFGLSTDSGDAHGEPRHSTSLPHGWLDSTKLEAALAAERQRTRQVPPALSAIKVAGRAAHRRVRAGQSVELEPRPVSVRRLELLDAGDLAVRVELQVSKGYYVRSFARDLANSLGVPAHLSALRRTASGTWSLDEAISWPPTAPVPLMPLSTAAARALPRCELSPAGVERARAGQLLQPEHFRGAPPPSEPEPIVAWCTGGGELVALGRATESGFRVVRGFRPEPTSDDLDPSDL